MPTKIDERTVKTAPAPAKGARTFWDSEVKGFGFRVFAATPRHPGGARSFFLDYRVDGAERRLTIGDYPTWSALAARHEAKDLRKRVDGGGDPAREKREKREAPDVGMLAERYRVEHLPGKAETSQTNDWAMIVNEILPVLGKRKVADIHHNDIVALHKRITASGRPVRANRVIAVASKMFSLSLLPLAGETKPWRDAAMGNPCRGLSRNREEGKERFFSPAELAAISDALHEYGDAPAADCLRLLMLSGARPAEALRARWDEFDEVGVWVKPAASVKQRRLHRAPLSPAATEMIERLRLTRADGAEFVFPFAGQPRKKLNKAWAFVRARAGLKASDRVYDMRHSFASVGAGGGLSLQIIGKLLGHTVARTTERYAHLSGDVLAEAAAKIGNVIAGAGKGDNGVITLKRGRSNGP
jgi:integrase